MEVTDYLDSEPANWVSDRILRAKLPQYVLFNRSSTEHLPTIGSRTTRSLLKCVCVCGGGGGVGVIKKVAMVSQIPCK